MDQIYFHKGRIHVVTPEGKRASMGIADFYAKLSERKIDTCGTVLVDGVKAMHSDHGTTILVHQSPPRPYNFKWIAPDSSLQYGKGAKYRTIRIALPYVILFAVFSQAGGKQQLTGRNECFFRTKPLEDLDKDADLYFPCLLNCSKFQRPEGNPLSWLCTQNLNFAALQQEADQNRRVRKSIQALLHCLFDTGFNFSSEHHEGSSWFTESCKVDPRVSTVEKWAEASEADPLFVLQVPWLKTGYTVRRLIDRIIKQCSPGQNGIVTEADLVRIILNQKNSG